MSKGPGNRKTHVVVGLPYQDWEIPKFNFNQIHSKVRLSQGLRCDFVRFALYQNACRDR